MIIFNFNSTYSDLESVIQDTSYYDGVPVQAAPIAINNWPLFVFFISLSTLFVASNLVIYALIWEHHNIHQWIQTAYLISLLLFNIVFIPALTPGGVSATNEVKLSCYILSLLNQFFFIFSKTWLLIISFDILSTLWKFEPSAGIQEDTKTFRLYAFLSFLVPSLFASAGVGLNILHRGRSESNSNDGKLWVPFPDYGHRHCRIPNWDIWEYFVFTNCGIHIILLALIVCIIGFHLCESQDGRNGRVRPSGHNLESILLFLRLVIVVGVSWSYIAIQDLLNAGNINTSQGMGWQIFRSIFFLQGLFVTLVYVGNRNTLGPLASKYPSFKNFQTNLKNRFLCRTPEKRHSVATIASNL